MASDNDGQSRALAREGVEALNRLTIALQSLAPTTIGVSTVAGLGAASTAGQGARRLVTDATVTTFASVVAGGGANVVPVYSDGSAWRIG